MNIVVRQVKNASFLSSLAKVGNKKSDQLSQVNSLWIMSLKRYLYVLGQTKVQADKTGACQKAGLQVLNRFEFSGHVKYAVFEDLKDGTEHENMIAIAHDQDKLVKFYDLKSFLEQDVEDMSDKEKGTDMLRLMPLYQ